jgi:hypothetical protein
MSWEIGERRPKQSFEVYRETIPAYGLSLEALKEYLELEFSDAPKSALVDQVSVPCDPSVKSQSLLCAS